jgi:glyoxylase-like metal-dependent hydrolase (beta-lactamase superfamily II)
MHQMSASSVRCQSESVANRKRLQDRSTTGARFMTRSYSIDPHTGWARFSHGDFTCTVVSDGVLEMGPAQGNFPNADPVEIDNLLRQFYLPTESVTLNQNLLVIDTGEKKILFDSGVGVLHSRNETSRKAFGTKGGRAVPNLRSAGIDPADIDIVAITHAHPDHCWGLVDEEGAFFYPNATVMVSQGDYDFWTDLSRIPDAPTEHLADHYRGAHANLLPYMEAGKLRTLKDGDQIVPGIDVIGTPGHSPGHIVYKITSGGETIICWGDLCHHEVLLLQRPDWAFQFDYDRPAATEQRRRIYDLADANRYAVFGYHFPYPGLGHLRHEENSYSWVPAAIDVPQS